MTQLIPIPGEKFETIFGKGEAVLKSIEFGHIASCASVTKIILVIFKTFPKFSQAKHAFTPRARKIPRENM